jgi:hypothetical protein
MIVSSTRVTTASSSMSPEGEALHVNRHWQPAMRRAGPAMSSPPAWLSIAALCAASRLRHQGLRALVPSMSSKVRVVASRHGTSRRYPRCGSIRRGTISLSSYNHVERTLSKIVLRQRRDGTMMSALTPRLTAAERTTFEAARRMTGSTNLVSGRCRTRLRAPRRARPQRRPPSAARTVAS